MQMRFLGTSIFTVCSLLTGQSLQAQALFEYQGKTYQADSLSPANRQTLFEIEYEQQAKVKDLADQAVLDLHLTQEAEKLKKPVDEIRKKLLEAADPTEKEMKEFYDKNKERIPYPLEQVKDQLKGHLKQEKSVKVQKDLLDKLKKAGKFAFKMPEPVVPVLEIKNENFARKGNAQSKLTVIEFADYQCPHCREAFETWEKVWPEVKDKVNFVFADYPINPSGISRLVAQGAFCAGKQNKYWEFHSLAFKKQAELSKEAPKKIADELKLDGKAFDGCLASAEAVQHVDKAKAEGDRIGIRGTPSIYFNGKRYLGAHDLQKLRDAIKAAL